MNSYLGVVIALAVLSSIFMLLGHCFFSLLRKKERFEFQWLFGFVIFLTIFALVDLPIELVGAPFHVLVYAELVVFLLITVLCVFYCKKEIQGIRRLKWQKPDCMTVLFIAIIVFQVIYGMGNRIHASYFDTSYYHGHAINALYTDTLYEYDAYTGVYMGDAAEWNDSYPMLIAVLAKCFAMHPLVVVNRIFGILEIITANLLIYEIAIQLSNGKRKVAVWTAGIHAVMSLLCWGLTDSGEYYLWVRMAESKSMLANVYIPFVLLGLVRLAKRAEDTYNWYVIMLIVFAGVSMSLSGIFMLLLMVGAGLLAILVYARKVKYLWYAVICVLPGIVMGAVRLLV